MRTELINCLPPLPLFKIFGSATAYGESGQRGMCPLRRPVESAPLMEWIQSCIRGRWCGHGCCVKSIGPSKTFNLWLDWLTITAFRRFLASVGSNDRLGIFIRVQWQWHYGRHLNAAKPCSGKLLQISFNYIQSVAYPGVGLGGSHPHWIFIILFWIMCVYCPNCAPILIKS